MGKSIDRVQIFDTPAAVERKLGQPTAIAYGDFAGFIYEYNDGRPAGLEVLFLELAEPLQDRAIQITASAPYRGTSKEGVGIGTPKAVARMVLGTPAMPRCPVDWDRFGVRTIYGDIYPFRPSAIVVNYGGDNRIESIRIIWLGEE